MRVEGDGESEQQTGWGLKHQAEEWAVWLGVQWQATPIFNQKSNGIREVFLEDSSRVSTR